MGFYASADPPYGCVPCQASCAAGEYVDDAACLAERLTAPVCRACATPLGAHRRWQAACVQVCDRGFVSNGSSSDCVLCDPSTQCALGTSGACVAADGGTTTLVCTPCPPALAMRRYTVRGSCEFTECLPGLQPAPAGWPQSCVSPETLRAVEDALQRPSTPAPSQAMGGVAKPGLRYPTRALPHS